MAEPIVWKGLAKVRPRPGADFTGHAADWREIAAGLTPERSVRCAGTFHTYESEDDDG